MKIGIIGCGNMGGGMAMRLAECGSKALCYDASAVLRSRLAEAGLTVAASAAELATESDLIFLSLPNASIVTAVMTEIDAHIKPGAIVLDASTSEPGTTKQLAAQAEGNGYVFLDGPVSGGPSAARSGAMTMLIGGDAKAIETARPVLDLLTAKLVIVGPSGAGHAAKIANNMLCAANLVLVAEAVRLGEAVGVSAADLLEGVNAGSGRSGVSEVNFPRWILNGAFDSGFTMGLMRKDVGLAVDLAARAGVSLNGFGPIAEIWAASAENLQDSEDFNAITTLNPGTEKS
jgi:3-hydroxyisobutyrate dehydrogenase